jgi:hypothetical protein
MKVLNWIAWRLLMTVEPVQCGIRGTEEVYVPEKEFVRE